MLNDPEVSGKILFAIYLAAGIPVAWLHIRQQRMLESVRQVRQPQAIAASLYACRHVAHSPRRHGLDVFAVKAATPAGADRGTAPIWLRG